LEAIGACVEKKRESLGEIGACPEQNGESLEEIAACVEEKRGSLVTIGACVEENSVFRDDRAAGRQARWNTGPPCRTRGTGVPDGKGAAHPAL
jgi:hypothetical protein